MRSASCQPVATATPDGVVRLRDGRVFTRPTRPALLARLTEPRSSADYHQTVSRVLNQLHRNRH